MWKLYEKQKKKKHFGTMKVFPSDILAVGKPAILPSLISAHGYGSV